MRPLPARVEVGRVRRPHGLRGELVVEPLTDVPGRLAAGSRLWLRAASGAERQVVVAGSRPHGRVLLVQLEGCADRQTAEGLRGAVLEIERRHIPPRAPGSYYHFELVGCRCRDRRQGALGEVVAVLEDGGGLLLEVRRGESRLLIPFVEAFVERIDIEKGAIELNLPPGLVETCTST